MHFYLVAFKYFEGQKKFGTPPRKVDKILNLIYIKNGAGTGLI
jgi:hypothetical protein